MSEYSGKIHCTICDHTYEVTGCVREREWTQCPVCMTPNSVICVRDENGDEIGRGSA
jgi:hypothetical protein